MCSKHADLASAADIEKVVEQRAGATEPTSFMGKWAKKAKDVALKGTTVDIHEVVEDDEYIAALHARAEKFDEHAEHAFGYLQVRTAKGWNPRKPSKNTALLLV